MSTKTKTLLDVAENAHEGEDYLVEIEVCTHGDEHVRTDPLSALIGWQRHAAELLHEEGSILTFVDSDGSVTMTRKGSL